MNAIKLVLPTDQSYLSLLNVFLRDLAARTGFSEHEGMKLQLAAEETFLNIVEHDFPPGAVEPVDVLWETDTLGVNLRFRHQGMPFDPALFPQLERATNQETCSAQGLGTFLMKQFMDEVQYNNLGHLGQEVVLKRILDHEGRKPPEVEPSAPRQEVSRNVPFAVRPLAPEESVAVSRLAYNAYSYSYPYEHIYFPERVRKLNQDGQLASFVAVTGDGEIIGHSAVIYDPSWPGVAELGVAFTNTEYRGLGCMNRLWDALIAESKRKAPFGLFVTGVTTHPFSQKTALKYGLKECALMLSKVPSIRFQEIDDGQSKRENLMLFFGLLAERPDVSVFLPSHHRPMLERIYAELGGTPRLEARDVALPLDPSVIEVTSSPASLVGNVKVKRAGHQAVSDVALALRRLCVSRMETIYLHLNLTDPGTARLCADFERLGFFFSGLLPQQSGEDTLVLQYLNNQNPDYAGITVASAFGRELLDYVKEQDPTWREVDRPSPVPPRATT